MLGSWFLEHGLGISGVSSESTITLSKRKAPLNQNNLLELLTTVEAVRVLNKFYTNSAALSNWPIRPENAVLNSKNLNPVL